MFGYKHSKAMKFYGQYIRCLRDSYYEEYLENFKVDMNVFILLKNELSLNFLRSTENLVATVKLAIRLYVQEAEKERANEERL